MYENDNYREDQGYDDYSYGNQVDYDMHTGDPALDLEYERQYATPYKVHEVIKKFIKYLHNALNEGLVFDIQNLYENDFPRLSEQYCKKSPWPEPEDIAPLVQNDEVFLIFYTELYYRHIYARVAGGPTLQHRVDSYFNYCKLFNYILSASNPVPLELPDVWLWELVDEFIYHFQSYCQYRSRLVKKSDESADSMRDDSKIWNVFSVLNVLHSLADKSNIKQQLEVFANGGDPDTVTGEFGRHPLYKMLGYFSLVGLLRLHSLLGDYYQAISCLENMELHRKNQYSHVPSCHITTSYYVGFAYLMMRRYADAISTFTSVLLYIQRTKNMFQPSTYQNDQINKQTEQMFTLLAVCLVLHPQCIDESVHAVLREKNNYPEKILRLQKGDLKEFETCFLFACPKFLSPVTPTLDSAGEVIQPVQQQLKVFLDEVQQQMYLPTIRSYLKLYTTMPIAKLASFMVTSEDNLINLLLCFKHKMKNLVWTKGPSGLEGEFRAGSEVDFYIDGDMIHIADTKVAQRYGDFFIRQIHKFEEFNRKLSSIKL